MASVDVDAAATLAAIEGDLSQLQTQRLNFGAMSRALESIKARLHQLY